MIYGEDPILNRITAATVHPKTIGKWLEFSVLHALERLYQVGAIYDYARLPLRDNNPDFKARTAEDGEEDTLPILITLPKGLKIEVECKNWGRSPAKHPQPNYPPFNRHHADEVEDKICNKGWAVEPQYRILVLSELHTDIFTETAVRVLHQNFPGRIVEVGYQVQKEFDENAIEEIYNQLILTFVLMADKGVVE